MSLNHTPSGERVHIGFFGLRNAGKSSLVNAVTGQELSVVSEIQGTTTDPVSKAMELLPVGPVVIIDTPGFDDEGTLGLLRVKKTKQVLNKTDVAVLVVDGTHPLTSIDYELIGLFKEKNIPYVVVFNKSDLLDSEIIIAEEIKAQSIIVSAEKKTNIWELKELIAKTAVGEINEKHLVSDLIQAKDFVVLVVPVDSAAPKGRLILPQQQVIRDILDANAVAITVQTPQLKETLKNLGQKPVMVITDSQAFEQVAKDTPKDIPLTSFSILMARYKGVLKDAAPGAYAIASLKDGDTVLISEGCTHHRQCDDIGTVKLPRWLKECTGKELNYEFSSGTGFPEDLSKYQLIIHCGGCMLNEREVLYRMKCAKDQGIPMTNYGTAIAYMKGILDRVLEPIRERL